jgi:NADH dehydrogenase FAD-containing subunit
MGEFATSLLQIGERLLVGADLNTVQGYTYPELGRDGIEFRFTAMVTSIKANKTVSIKKSNQKDFERNVISVSSRLLRRHDDQSGPFGQI